MKKNALKQTGNIPLWLHITHKKLQPSLLIMLSVLSTTGIAGASMPCQHVDIKLTGCVIDNRISGHMTVYSQSSKESPYEHDVIDYVLKFRGPCEAFDSKMYEGKVISFRTQQTSQCRPTFIRCPANVRIEGSCFPVSLDGSVSDEPRKVFANTNGKGVFNGGQPPWVTFDSATKVTSIMTYHWNNGRGQHPGTISLHSDNGATYGPWQAAGAPGSGGVQDAYWIVKPNVVVPAGRYQVIDSNPGTWAQNSGSGGLGMAEIEGIRQEEVGVKRK